MGAKSTVFVTESDCEASVVSLTTISTLLPGASNETAKATNAPDKTVSTNAAVDKSFTPIFDTRVEKSFGLVIIHQILGGALSLNVLVIALKRTMGHSQRWIRMPITIGKRFRTVIVINIRI